MRRALLRGIAAVVLAAGTLAPTRTAAAQRPAPTRVSGPRAAAPVVAPPAAARTAPASTLTISLLTMGPGDAVWEKFGHNAIRVRDSATGEDVAYNWGMFDFAQPNFLGRFLTGDTRYWMEPIPTSLMLGQYVDRNRSVWEQELALTPARRAELRRFLEWNAREENKFYRYDYYRDNCSTRVRDAIDRVAGGALQRATGSVATGTTYRSHTRRLTRADLPVYTGIQLALGHPADRPISAWEAAFLPTELQRSVRRAVIADTGGAPVSLVLAERELFVARRAPGPAGPPNYTLGYLVAGLAVGAVVSALARPAARGGRVASGALAAVTGVWGLAAGFLGTALLLAGTVTRHVFMGRNENLLLVNPLLLLVAAALPFALLSRNRRGIAVAARLAGAVALLSTLALLVKAVPAFDQRNLELVALFLPPHLAVALAARRVAEAAGAGEPAHPAPSRRVPGAVATRA